MSRSAMAKARRDGLLSRQTERASCFFLDLAPPCRPWVLAMGGVETCRADYHLRRENFPYHVVEFIVSGSGTVTLGGRDHAVAAGSVFAVAGDEPLKLVTDANHRIHKVFLAVGGSSAAARLRAVGLEPGAVASVRGAVARRELADLAKCVVREGRRHGPRAEELCHALLDAWLIKLSASIAGTDAAGLAEGNFARCRDVLDRWRLDRPMSLDDLAREAGMDISSACRLFRRFAGRSPQRYLMERRMRRAAELLWDGRLLVKEVAGRVGFDDPYHFSRCFRRVHGVAPSVLAGR